MSITTGFRPDESEFEPVPDGLLADIEEALAVEPRQAGPALPKRAGRPKRPTRLSRRWRLVRTGIFVLVLEVALSSFGLLPGRGWPLSLIEGAGAGASDRATGTAGAIVGVGTGTERLAPARSVVPPALWAFAAAKGLTLYLPTHTLLGIGYHEAATRDGLSITPLGTCVENENRARIRTPEATGGPKYVILQTRHRRQGPTTAVDVAMPKGTTVLAPVTGTVMQVTAYRLYKYWLDYRVVIRPAQNARLRVIMIHLADLKVRRGSRVVAAVTPLGVPRVFPFKSDINDYVGAGVPHVHLEVKELGPPRRTA